MARQSLSLMAVVCARLAVGPRTCGSVASENPSLALHERIGQSLQALLASYTDIRSLAFKLATGR